MKRVASRLVGLKFLLLLATLALSLLLASCGEVTQEATYSLSGNVSSGGSALSGVTMMLSGASSATVTTDANGNYTFNGLSNGSYTITPSKTGFSFTPTSKIQSVSGANVTAVSFTATAVSTFSISGTVTAAGAGLPGVTLTLGGASTATTTTDVNGSYTLSGLANGSYTITPGKVGTTFTPTSSPQIVNGANLTAVNFTATGAQIVACPAAGTTNVTIQDSAFALATVTVNVNGIVKWTSSSSLTHTVTSGSLSTSDGKFASGNLGTGETFCVQFLTAGPFPYFCSLHPFMVGSVTAQ